jgi:hypothetical protein
MNHLARYTTGHYATRNAIIADWISEATPEQVVEVAGAVPQLAQAVLRRCPSVRAYHWIEQDPEAVAFAATELEGNPRFTTWLADANTVTLPGCDVFVSPSLEHLDNDLGLLAQLEIGTNVFLTCPGFWDSGGNHKRMFTGEHAVRQRYGDLLMFRRLLDQRPVVRKILVWGVRM